MKEWQTRTVHCIDVTIHTCYKYDKFQNQSCICAAFYDAINHKFFTTDNARIARFQQKEYHDGIPHGFTQAIPDITSP